MSDVDLIKRLRRRRRQKGLYYGEAIYEADPDCQDAASRLEACLQSSITWRSIDTAPKDGSPFWGKCEDDAIRMFWHPFFNAFISSYRQMDLAKGMTFADTGLSYKMHSPEIHEPTHWMPLPNNAEEGA